MQLRNMLFTSAYDIKIKEINFTYIEACVYRVCQSCINPEALSSFIFGEGAALIEEAFCELTTQSDESIN